jgi:hypothetical protein
MKKVKKETIINNDDFDKYAGAVVPPIFRIHYLFSMIGRLPI